MTEIAAELPAKKPALWQNFGYYTAWWCVLMGVGSALQPVTGSVDFWPAKVWQLLAGIGFGLVCSVIFTLCQNKLNPARKRLLNWIFAITIWTSMKFLVAGLAGAF